MKKIIKRGLPLFLACLILVGVPLTSYENVKASGVEEYLYYTYWDLMTSIFAAQGYDMQVKDSVVNTHGVTGKQVWHNFTTWVKTNAKKVYDEAVALPKIVTAEGIKMSQDLWDAFKDYASYCSGGSSSSSSDYVQSDSFNMGPLLRSFCPELPSNFLYRLNTKEYSPLIYTVDSDDGHFFCMTYISRIDYGSIKNIFVSSNDDFKINTDKGICDFTLNGFCFRYVDGVYKSYAPHPAISVDRTYASIHNLWADGLTINPNSDIYSIVSQGACPAEVPDVSPWIKNPTIPDEWRIVQPGEVPEKDPDNNPEKVPVIIPFKPPKPQKPEKPDSTEETNPDKDKDKDKKKKPAVNPIINPQTGNVIDPETGLDIDPDTGKLIDPDTGKLIDPDDGGSGGGGGGGIADKLGKYGDITKLFPFCIPFDIVNLIKGMSAEKAPPVFHFKYYFKSINYTFKVDVDLSKYAKYIKLFRYGMQIFYILALMFMTIRISKLFS